jgi:hypothetical protein
MDHAFGGWVIGGLYKSTLISVAAGAAFKPGTDDVAAKAAKSEWVWYPKDDDHKDNEGIWKEEEITAATPRIPGAAPYVDAILGVEVSPVSALKVAVDGRFDTRKFEDHAKIGSNRIGLKGVYTVSSALSVHLQGDLRIQNEAMADLQKDIVKAKADSHLKAVANAVQASQASKDAKTLEDQAKVYYADYVPVGNPGDASLAFRIGADYKVTDTIGVYLQIGSDNILWFAGDIDLKESAEYAAKEQAKGADMNYDAYWKYQMPGAGLYAKLGGKITLGTSSIEIFDKINRIGATDLQKANAKDASKFDSWSPITNQFQIDFNWVF